MTADTRRQVRGVLLAVLLVTSLAAVSMPASAGVKSASRSAPSTATPNSTVTVTLSATMNSSGGDVILADYLSGPVADTRIRSVTVNGQQAVPTITTHNPGDVSALLQQVAPNATVEMEYVIEVNGSTGTITLDGTAGGIDIQEETITVQSSNSAPTADAGPDRTVSGGTSIELDGTGSSDPDGDSLDYYWNGSQHLSDRQTATPTFQAPSVSSQQTFQLNLRVEDPSGASDGDSVTITVEPSSSGPNDLDGDGLYEDVNGDGTFSVADPQKLENKVAIDIGRGRLDPAKFDFDGDGEWGQGDICALYAEAGTTPSSCQQTTGSATVSVTSLSAPSTVSAGETLTVEATVENTGTANATGDVEFSFDGSVVETTSVTVDAGGQTHVQFDFDTSNLAAGTYSYRVITPNDSATGSVTLKSSTGGNSAPTADAGFDRTVGSGETVELDGTGSSDPDGDALTYTWTRQDTGDTYSGARVTLDVPTVDSTTSFDVELTVSDGTASDTDTVTVTVDPGNRAPTADAGPNRTVVAGENVTLDGSNSSDPDSDALAYNWRQLSGPTVYVRNTPRDTFEAPAVSEVRTLAFELEVSDAVASDTDTAFVTVRPAAAVTMNDQKSDGEQVRVASVRLRKGGSYLAVRKPGSGDQLLGLRPLSAGQHQDVVVTLNESLSPGTRVIEALPLRDADGDDTLETIPPGADDPVSDRATVTVPNEPPTADAGPDRSTRAGDSITLDGSGSSDPDGDDLTYEWRQVEGPSAELVNASGPTARVVPEAAGTVVIELDVSDGNATATDTVAVEVTERETTAAATSTPTTASPTATPTTATPAPTTTPTTTPPLTTTATPAPTTTAAGSGGNDGTVEIAGMDVPMMPVAGGATALVALLLVGAVWRRRGDDEDDGSAAATGEDGGEADSGDTSLEDALLPEDDDAGGPETGTVGSSTDADSGAGATGTDGDTTDGGASADADGEGATDETGADEAGASAPASAAGTAGAAGATGDDESEGSDTPTGISYDDIEKGERIGGGGNAHVYRGSLTGAHGAVDIAIKEPHMQGTISGADVERVLEEAETWHKLDDHEGVVDVLGWGSEPLPWIAMEYMDGGNLADAVPLPFDRGQAVLMSVASAVEYAHRAGVAHGDLKPANVLFAGDPARHGVAKVGDWGLAKVLLEQSRSTEGLSPAYAAPEQFEGGTRDIVGPQLTDVYQLGAVAYEVFTGRPPFEGTPFEVMESIKSDEPIPPTAVDPGLPAAVDEVVLTAMAKDPDERYETMTDFRRALEDL